MADRHPYNDKPFHPTVEAAQLLGEKPRRCVHCWSRSCAAVLEPTQWDHPICIDYKPRRN